MGRVKELAIEIDESKETLADLAKRFEVLNEIFQRDENSPVVDEMAEIASRIDTLEMRVRQIETTLGIDPK